MKNTTKYITLYITLFFSVTIFGFSNPNKELQALVSSLVKEIESVQQKYGVLHINLEKELQNCTDALNSSKDTTNKINLLIKKEQLKEQLNKLNLSETSDISKIRYIKGLQIIKILYEKTLSLDHHFASVATFNEINNLSNPNHYPEFTKMKDNLKSKRDKKQGFNLSSLLGNNIYTSVIHSVVSLFSNTNASRAEKESSMEEVECILDFTLRMHNDLNTIYFETAFLQKSNDNVMKELEKLFTDFTKPIKYKTPLKECRANDDWDSIKENLNTYLEHLNKAISDSSQKYKAHKMRINLEFPIDRLLQFITIYNSHIDQGTKFYEKFGIMLDSYQNEKQCATKIPQEYTKLKESIKIAIEKFNTAYKPVEINGSKMKQVLYGINEYD